MYSGGMPETISILLVPRIDRIFAGGPKRSTVNATSGVSLQRANLRGRRRRTDDDALATPIEADRYHSWLTILSVVCEMTKGAVQQLLR